MKKAKCKIRVLRPMVAEPLDVQGEPLVMCDRPAPLKVLTFGSCLSKYIAEALERAGVALVREGSVYHNRIDIFVDVYVDKTRPAMPRAVLAQLQHKPKSLAENAILINNQLDDAQGTLGRHLCPGQAGFMAALATADLILMDNFIDTVSQAMQHTKGPERIFLNYKGLDNGDEHLRTMGMLQPTIGFAKWKRLVQWIKTHNPRAKLVFSQFPHAHHRNASVRKLGAGWDAVMPGLPGVLFCPAPVLTPDKLIPGTQAHFQPAVYDRYVPGILKYLSDSSGGA